MVNDGKSQDLKGAREKKKSLTVFPERCKILRLLWNYDLESSCGAGREEAPSAGRGMSPRWSLGDTRHCWLFRAPHFTDLNKKGRCQSGGGDELRNRGATDGRDFQVVLHVSLV